MTLIKLIHIYDIMICFTTLLTHCSGFSTKNILLHTDNKVYCTCCGQLFHAFAYKVNKNLVPDVSLYFYMNQTIEYFHNICTVTKYHCLILSTLPYLVSMNMCDIIHEEGQPGISGMYLSLISGQI